MKANIFMKSGNILKIESEEITINRCGDELNGIYFDTDSMNIKIEYLDLEQIECITLEK